MSRKSGLHRIILRPAPFIEVGWAISLSECFRMSVRNFGMRVPNFRTYILNFRTEPGGAAGSWAVAGKLLFADRQCLVAYGLKWGSGR